MRGYSIGTIGTEEKLVDSSTITNFMAKFYKSLSLLDLFSKRASDLPSAHGFAKIASKNSFDIVIYVIKCVKMKKYLSQTSFNIGSIITNDPEVNIKNVNTA